MYLLAVDGERAGRGHRGHVVHLLVNQLVQYRVGGPVAEDPRVHRFAVQWQVDALHGSAGVWVGVQRERAFAPLERARHVVVVFPCADR